MHISGDDELVIYDCSKKIFHQTSAKAMQAVFFKDNTILLNNFDNISEYNLNTNRETIIYQDEFFDFFAVCNINILSLAQDNYIHIYNIKTKEKKVLVQDNGCEIHSWSDDGKILYYSDVYGKIKSFNVMSGESKEIGTGYDPIVCGTNIAYKSKGELIVKNVQTHNEIVYDGKAYSYCFSSDGNALIIEDELSTGTALKNLFSNGDVLGHSIIFWDYVNDEKNTIINSCVPRPYLICDSKTGTQ